MREVLKVYKPRHDSGNGVMVRNKDKSKMAYADLIDKRNYKFPLPIWGDRYFTGTIKNDEQDVVLYNEVENPGW